MSRKDPANRQAIRQAKIANGQRRRVGTPTLTREQMQQTLEERHGSFTDDDWREAFGDGGTEVLPCEICGLHPEPNHKDQFTTLKGARSTPLGSLDARAALRNDRIVRICADCASEPDVRRALTKLDIADLSTYSPLKVAQAHRAAMNDLRSSETHIQNQASLLDGEAKEIYDSIMDGLRTLVEMGQVPAEALSRHPEHTIKILSELRTKHGDITSRPDLSELFNERFNTTEWCTQCEQIYPKGEGHHIHMEIQQEASAEAAALPSLKDLPPIPTNMGPLEVNGSRECNSAQLHTLNLLANFMAFEKTIPFDLMRKIDLRGVHILGFETSGDQARGVQVQDYFRTRINMKLIGRDAPYKVVLDIPPSWFLRLPQIDREAAGLPTKVTRGTIRRSALDLVNAPGIDHHRSIPVQMNGEGMLEVTGPDGKVTVVDPDDVSTDPSSGDVTLDLDGLTIEQRRALKMLIDAAEAQGLDSYRDLGEYDAWMFLAEHPNPAVVKNRFTAALACTYMSWERWEGDKKNGRPFTVTDVQTLLMRMRDPDSNDGETYTFPEHTPVPPRIPTIGWDGVER